MHGRSSGQRHEAAARLNPSPDGYFIVPYGGELRCPCCHLWLMALGKEIGARVVWYEKGMRIIPADVAVVTRCSHRRCEIILQIEYSRLAYSAPEAA